MKLFEIENKEEKFFSEKKYLSYSALTRLMFSPTLYYKHYVLEEKEDIETQSMKEGRLIHCLLLQPENFNKMYEIAFDKLPSTNSKTVIDYIYQCYLIENDDNKTMEDFKDNILNKLIEMNLHQSLKTDESRLAKIIEPQENIDYFNFLKRSTGKEIITQQLYNYALGIVDNIIKNDTITKHIGSNILNFDSLTETFNELYLEADIPELEMFGLKGILDNLTIDHKNKIIKINDFKTSNKSINDFLETIEYYNYWLQVVIYYLLVINSKYYKDDYDIEIRFLVSDNYGQVATFLVSKDTLEEWIKRSNEIFDIAEYHFKTQDFSLPYKFLINKGELII